MTKLRVCMLTWYYKPRISGTANVIENMNKYLLKSGVEIYVLTRREKGVPDRETLNGAKVFRMKELMIGYDFDVTLKKISKFLKDNKIDILHTHNFHKILPSLEMKGKNSLQQNLAVFWAAKSAGIPITLSLHNYGDPILVNMGWDHLFPITQDMERFTRKCGAQKDKITYIYNTVDTDFFRSEKPKYRKKFGIKGDEKLVFSPIPLFTIEQAKKRGVMVMLKAASIVKKRFKKFKILLPGFESLMKNHVIKLQKQILSEAKSLGLEDNVIFFPKTLPSSELSALYSSSDLVVNPSIIGEPFGLQFIEAGACGKPVIGTRGGGVPEIVRNGHNGFLVDMKNVRQMADAMYRILSDDELGKRLGRNNRKVANEKFSINAQIPKVLKVYRQLLKGKG